MYSFMMAALQEYGSARPKSVGYVRFLRMAGEFVTAGDGTLRDVARERAWRARAGERVSLRDSSIHGILRGDLHGF